MKKPTKKTKTKAELEKDLAKVTKQLEFYQKCAVNQPPALNTNIEKTNECKVNIPEFQDLLDRLSSELNIQRELCEKALIKINNIDGLPVDDSKKDSKVYKMGVVGAIDQLNDYAQNNREMMTTIASRLTNLVG